jgi:phosphatidylglycerol---prolipoprotein diacylglyceryl transferase
MEFESPGAILFKVGSFAIRWYGVLIALGFISATYILSRRATQWGMNSEKIVNAALVAFIGGIVGARLYYVMLSWSYFQTHLSEIGATWNGGMSIHGGIIGGAVAGFFYCRKEKLAALEVADLCASVIPLGQAIGRWGNFFNSELFGQPVPDSFPLKLFISEEHRPIGFEQNAFFHPTFLYESIWDLLLFFILFNFALTKFKKYPGLTSLLFLAGYSVGRILIEPLRLDSIKFGGMQAPLIVSIIWLLLSLVAIVMLIMHYKGKSKSNETSS